MTQANFKHAPVRDLAWTGFAPQLLRTPAIQGAGIQLDGFWQSHLDQLDEDPEPLLNYIADRDTGRLGLYYETLWHYLLKTDPNIELLAHNVPVRDEKRTIGEFDCLYWSEVDQRHIHLEMTIKFYLGVPDRDIWLGPGQRDRLDRKLAKITEQQARLSAHPAAQLALAELGIDHCESRIDFKGYLFQPAMGMTPPEAINPDWPLQRWFSFSQFAALPPLDSNWLGWQRIPRRRWLSPYVAAEDTSPGDNPVAAEIERRLADKGRPQQLAACDENGRERYRCFVTPDGWPDRL